jgi:uncharacterized protein (DUF1697 family)
MRYVALLRAVNVGGRNLLSMAALKQCLEGIGLGNVRTFIQSGNVVFDSGESSRPGLTARIERAITSATGLESRIVLLSQAQLGSVLDAAPASWPRRTDLRKNIAFLRPGTTASQAAKAVKTNPAVDQMTVGKSVLYLATLMSGLQKSGLRTVIGTPAYREMTIRTYGTCQKILALMEDARPSRASAPR